MIPVRTEYGGIAGTLAEAFAAAEARGAWAQDRYNVYRFGLDGKYVWRYQRTGLTAQQKADDTAQLMRAVRRPLPEPVTLAPDVLAENKRRFDEFMRSNHFEEFTRSFGQ